MAEDYSKYLPKGPLLGGPSGLTPRPKTFGEDLGLAFGSTLNSIPELFGLEGFIKPDEVEEWRAQNPGLNLATQFAGMLVPYLGWARAGEAVLNAPKVPRALEGASKLFKGWEAGKATAPISSAIKQDLMLTLSFEGLRLGSVAANAPEDLSGELGNTALGLGLLPAFHGGVGLLRAAAPFRAAGEKTAGFLPEFPVGGSIQDQLGYLYDNVANAPKEAQAWLTAQTTALERQILGQQPRGAKYVAGLNGGGSSKDVNRLFQMKADPNLQRRQFIVSPTTGFGSRAEADAQLAAAGFQPGWGRHVQFPRHVQAHDQANARAIQKTVSKNLKPVQNGWYIGEEADSGLFVAARKIAGDPAKPAGSDGWVFLKTSDPNALIGRDVVTLGADRQVKFANALQRQRELKGLSEMAPDSIARVVDDARTTFSARPKPKGAEAALDAAPGSSALKTGLQAVKGSLAEERAAVENIWDFARDKVVPAQAEFSSKPLAERARLVAQTAVDVAKAKAQRVLYGPQGLKVGQSIYGRLVSQETPKGLSKLIDALEKEDLPYVSMIRNAEVGAAERLQVLANAGATPKQMERVEALFSKLDEADSALTKETEAAEALYGEKNFKPRENHYLISHTWKGTWRHRVLDEKGNTISIGAGTTRAEAIKAARAEAERLGARMDDRGPFQTDFESDADLAKSLFKRQRSALDRRARQLGIDPLTFRLRQGVSGFTGELEPLTKKELHDIIAKTVGGRYQYLAEQAIKHQLMPDIMEVYSRYGMKTFKALVYRINQMFGIKGQVNRLQNEAMDKVLAPVLGKNSADKLVSAYNGSEMFLSLLAMNLSHPIMNALTFVQTVLPKASYVLGATPESMEKVMGFVPHFDPAGRPAGVAAVFEPLKLALRSFRDMAQPDDELRTIFNRAAGEGTITSGLQEHYVGERSGVGKWVSNNLSETNPARRMLEHLDTSPILNPAKKSEELSRAHALVVGRNLARVIGVNDPEQVYQFAKQFTNRTMYQYTTADRPKLFNGPIGSLFGLFKNWAFHYLSDLSLYGGAAAKREQFAPLLWALGGQAALAGVGGTAGFGVADGASKLLTNQGLMDNLYSMFDPDDKDMADTIFYGLPALLGISLQANASSPFANPVKDISYLTNFAIVDRAKKIASAATYFSQQLGTGQNPLANDQTWDKMAYALAPRTLYKSLAMVEDGALKAASNGQPIIQGLSGLDQLTNSFGLTPVEIAKAWELNDRLFLEKEKRASLTASLGEVYFQAMLRQDSGAMQEVLRAALLQGADVGSVMKSVQAKLRASRVPSLESGLAGSPNIAAQAQNLGFGF